MPACCGACAIRHAILTGELDARIGLQHIDAERRDLWASRLDEAEASQPSDFTNNGWVVEALQAAWSAIATTPVPQDDPAKGVFRVDHLRLALDAAVRGGERHRHRRGHRGRTARRRLRGVSGPCRLASRAARLAGPAHPRPGRTGLQIIRKGKPDGFDFSYSGYETGVVARHPYDDGVWLGGHRRSAVAARRRRCGRVAVPGQRRRPARPRRTARCPPHRPRPGDNANLDFVLLDTVRAVEQLRRRAGPC